LNVNEKNIKLKNEYIKSNNLHKNRKNISKEFSANDNYISNQNSFEKSECIISHALNFIQSLRPCKFENISYNNIEFSDNDCERIIIEKNDSINEKLYTMNLLELSLFIETEKNIEVLDNKFLLLGEFITENSKYFQVYYRKLPD